MTTFTEGKRPLQFLLSEANFHRSRDTVTVLSGEGKLAAGTVLGKVTASGKYKKVTVAAADGSQNGIAVLAYAVDATSADATGVVIARDAEVKAPELTYGADVDQASEIAAVKTSLAGVGIIVR